MTPCTDRDTVPFTTRGPQKRMHARRPQVRVRHGREDVHRLAERSGAPRGAVHINLHRRLLGRQSVWKPCERVSYNHHTHALSYDVLLRRPEPNPRVVDCSLGPIRFVIVHLQNHVAEITGLFAYL